MFLAHEGSTKKEMLKFLKFVLGKLALQFSYKLEVKQYYPSELKCPRQTIQQILLFINVCKRDKLLHTIISYFNFR